MIEYCPKQINMGMKVEQEHKDITHGDPVITRKIVNAHLKEDKDYYTKLKKMEAGGKYWMLRPARQLRVLPGRFATDSNAYWIKRGLMSKRASAVKPDVNLTNCFMHPVKALHYGSVTPMHVNPLQNWPGIYNTTLKSLSGKHKEDHEQDVHQHLSLLKKLQREAWIHKRGDIWIPEPDKHSGYYPAIDDVPFEHLKTAIRANTSPEVRKSMWEIIKNSARRFLPLKPNFNANGLDTDQQRQMLENFAVALPLEVGRTSKFLGNKVPGDLEFGSSESHSVAPIGRVDPEFKKNLLGKGYNVMKFNNVQPVKTVHYTFKSTVAKGFEHWDKAAAALHNIRVAHPILATAADRTVVAGGTLAAVKIGQRHGKKNPKKDMSTGDAFWRMSLMGNQYPNYVQGLEEGKRAATKRKKKYALKYWTDMPLAAYLEATRAAKVEGVLPPWDKIATVAKKVSHWKRNLGIGGTAAGGLAIAASSKKKTQSDLQTGYAYGQGMHYDLAEVKAQAKEWLHDAKLWALGNVVPRATRMATQIALGQVHQSVGLPPMTISGETLRRPSFDTKFAPMANWQLDDVINSVRTRLASSTDTEEQKGLQKTLQSLYSEMAMRNASSITG